MAVGPIIMTESEVLFTEVLNCNRPELYLNKDMVLPKDKALVISSVLKRRALGEPLEYILGKAEFMGLEFKVNKDVLIPRADTEILVEAVFDLAVNHQLSTTNLSILELGTGSGCIAVSLAKFLHNVKVTAVDIYKPALEIAKENAVLNEVENKIDFIEGDLFSSCVARCAPRDLIVTNPPYIPTREIDGLQPEVQYEPRIALDGGADGLDFYRKIIEQSGRYLKKSGLLVIEMGFGQKEKIEKLFQNTQDFEIIDIIKDYNGIERVIVARGHG